MNNLLLPQKEKKVATAIGLIPALILLIIWYVLKLIAKALNKWKKQVYKASLAVFVLYGLCSFFIQVVDAPKADASQPYLERTAPAPTPTVSELENIVSYIARVFESEGKAVVVKAINCFYSESGLREEAVGQNSDGPKSKDHGVAQLNDYWHKLTPEEKTEYKANIDRAYEIYKGNGHTFNPWYGKGCK